MINRRVIQITLFDLNPDNQEIIIAFLSDYPVDSFWQDEDKLKVFTEEIDPNEIISAVKSISEEFANINFSVEELPEKNWNEIWESGFEAITLENGLNIRAPFHKQVNPEFEIVLSPKMAFGTGHHPTTESVILLMSMYDFKGKSVLDIGCGTSILSIFAEKLGAANIYAFDNDQFAVENSIENCTVNNCTGISVELKELENLEHDQYDFVLMNVTRNTILEHSDVISKLLNRNGIVLVSGFYAADRSAITSALTNLNLLELNSIEKDSWMAMSFQKID